MIGPSSTPMVHSAITLPCSSRGYSCISATCASGTNAAPNRPCAVDDRCGGLPAPTIPRIDPADLGLLFGVISTPCAVPILAVLLAFIAAKGSVLYGGALLLTYALGHCMLVLVCGVSAGAVKAILGSSRWASANLWLRRCAGAVVILVGAYVVLAPIFHWGA